MADTVRRGADRASRLARAATLSGTSGKVSPADLATRLLEAIIQPGDRVTVEGDNHKQSDFLACVTGPSCVRPMSTYCSKLEPMRGARTRATERRVNGDTTSKSRASGAALRRHAVQPDIPSHP